MALSHLLEAVLALAAETSTVDDQALDELGRRLLAALILDPETPEHVKGRAVRLLRDTEDPS